jgi:hypothetical protein
MFHTKVVENIDKHFVFNIFFFFRKSWHSRDNVDQYGPTRQDTEDNIIRPMLFAC